MAKKPTRRPTPAKPPVKKAKPAAAAKSAAKPKPASRTGKTPSRPAGKSGGKPRPDVPARRVVPSQPAAPVPIAAPVPAPIKPTLQTERADADIALTDDDLRKVKTGLSKKDLHHYRDLLMTKRREILGTVDAMQTDARNTAGNLSNLPLHMADVGSDNYEQEFTLGLVESEKQLLREIDRALIRIDNGTYGVCVESGKPIGRARLDAKPWAQYCIEVAREKERYSGRR